MNLSIRLSHVAGVVVPCKKIADIGCDHGYVSIKLVSDGTVKRAICCDINKGPLESAKKNIVEAGFIDRIETRLSDGLKKINKEDELDGVIIAGMGGRLMERILNDRIDIVKDVKQLVLQPQSEIFLIRKWVRENGFFINQEKICIDDEKYYFILDIRRGESEEYPEDLTEVYDYFSKDLISKKDPILIEYLHRGLNNNLKYLEGIESSRQERLLLENKRIELALSLMEQKRR